jgi:hypothetical protein
VVASGGVRGAEAWLRVVIVGGVGSSGEERAGRVTGYILGVGKLVG